MQARMRAASFIAMVSAIAVGGCDTFTGRPTTSTTTRPDQRTTTQTDASSSQTTRTTQATPRGRIFGFSEVSFPTGEGRSSLVQISAEPLRDEARVGQPFPYRLKVANLSRDLTLEGVTVIQELPGSFEMSAGAQPPGEPPRERPPGDAAAGRWSVGTLQPGESRTLEVSVLPSQPGEFQSCFRVAYEPVLCTTINVTAPSLAIDLQAPESASLCDPIPVRVMVRNTGTGSTDPVQVRLLTPEGVTPAQAQGGQGGRADGALSFDAGQLSAGASREFTAHLKPDKIGRYTFAAVAESREGMKAQSTETTINVWAAQLETSIAGPETGFIRSNAPYRVTVRNSGNGPAEQATLRISMDRSARVIEPRARTEDQVAVIDLGTIAPGDQREIPLVLFSNDAGPLRIRADAQARCAQTRPGELVTNFQTAPALLLEVIDTQDPVLVGAEQVYRITVVNQGTGVDRDVTITAEIPEAFEFVTTGGPTPARVDGNTILFAPLANLEAGATATWTVTLKALRPGNIRFRAGFQSETIREPAYELEPTQIH
ncbi:MAG: hypothetical protein WD749_03455 [Phycisphaerales bacterium]